MKQVMEKETAELVESQEDALAYETKLADVSVSVVYRFEDDKLMRATYIGRQDYYHAENYLDDYAKFKRLLTAKYGNPTTDKEYWSDNVYRKSGKRRDLAMALKIGHLSLHSIWHTADTEIGLSVFGKEYEVSFGVFYESKEFRHLADRISKRQEAADLSDF